MTPYGYNSGGYAEYRNDQLQDLTNQNYLTYTESFNDHNLSLMIGTAAEWHERSNFLECKTDYLHWKALLFMGLAEEQPLRFLI